MPVPAGYTENPQQPQASAGGQPPPGYAESAPPADAQPSKLQRFAQSWWDNSVLKHPIDSAIGLVKSLVTFPDYRQLSQAEQDAVDAQMQKAMSDMGAFVEHPLDHPEYAGLIAAKVTNPAIVGAATMGLAKGLGAAVDVAPQAWTAAKAGVQAAAPDVAIGGFKVAAGSAAAEVLPGGPIKYALAAAPAYAGGRQIMKGLAKGAVAARDSFATPVAAPAVAVADAATATAATADAAQFDPIAKAMAGKPFAELSPQQQQAIRASVARDAAAAAPAPAPAPAAPTPGQPPPGYAEAAAPTPGKPRWEPGPPGAPEPPARWEPPEQAGRPAPTPTLSPDPALAAQRRIEDAADQHAAYLQNQAEEITWANRARKADRFAEYLRQNDLDPTPENLATAARAMHEKGPPSDETVPMIHDRMGYTEPAQPTATPQLAPANLAQQLRDSLAAINARKAVRPGDTVGIKGVPHTITQVHADQSFDAKPTGP